MLYAISETVFYNVCVRGCAWMARVLFATDSSRAINFDFEKKKKTSILSISIIKNYSHSFQLSSRFTMDLKSASRGM